MTHIVNDRFTGFSELYNQSRPMAPKSICTTILKLMGKERIETVVDLGCGTGLSTGIWRDFSDKIIGIEPNDDMRKVAAENDHDINFIKANSYDTGLNDSSVDVVTCSQSFHWMEPVDTLKEVNRILIKKGVYCAYDYFWPGSISDKAEKAYKVLFSEVNRLHDYYKDILPDDRKWSKDNHLKSIKDSGYFEHCYEIMIDNTEYFDADRFINMALAHGNLQNLLKRNIVEIETFIDEFKNEIYEDIKDVKIMTIKYRLVIGIK